MDDAAVAQMTKKLAACHINVSDISLEVRNLLFYIYLTFLPFLYFLCENKFTEFVIAGVHFSQMFAI